jgi:protein-disulfide isomerase
MDLTKEMIVIAKKYLFLGASLAVLATVPLFFQIEAKQNEAIAASEISPAAAGGSTTAGTASFNDAQKAELEDVILNFILNNPEVLMESVNKFQQDQVRKQDETAKTALNALKGFLTSADMPSVGPQDADITVIEFLDYNCGYCKRAYETVRDAIKDDKKLRVVFIEHPILSDNSRRASEYAMAAHLQGKYWEYHTALMTFQGPKNEDILLKKAEEIGLNLDQLKKDAKGEKVKELLQKKLDASTQLAISGTPAFIVGDEIIRGYIPYEVMKPMIAEQRKKAKG